MLRWVEDNRRESWMLVSERGDRTIFASVYRSSASRPFPVHRVYVGHDFVGRKTSLDEAMALAENHLPELLLLAYGLEDR